MANDLKKVDLIAAEAVMILENNLVMAKKVHRGYEDEFEKSVNGYEPGESVSIRRPADFTVRSGAVASSQDVKEGKLPFTVNIQEGVDFEFTSKELTLDIKDISDRVMKPALIQLANSVDRKIMDLYKYVPNWVGTPGQMVNSFTDFYKAPERLDEYGVPNEMRCGVLSPADHAALLGPQTALYINDAAKGAYRSGKLGPLGGVETYMSQNVPTHTCGADTDDAGGAAVDGAWTASTIAYDDVKDLERTPQTLTFDSFATAAPALNPGDVFTVAGLYAVNPVTKARLPFLKQFTVISTANAATNQVDVTFSPAAIWTGAHKNVDTDASDLDNAVVTFMGTGGENYRQNMVFHKNAFGLVMVPMVSPPGAVDVARKTHKGVSVRVIPVYDGTNDKSMYRLDILYGVQAIDPRLATRLSGTP
ncbi:MAG: P22 phage major capsid protein family protein [Pseudomonadota bacterium]